MINVVNVLLAIPNPPQPIHWEIGLWLSLLASTSVLVSGIGMVRSEHGSLGLQAKHFPQAREGPQPL